MIKPFTRIRLPPSRGKIVTVSYLQKALSAVLSRFNITVEGGDIQETGEGHLHLKVNASAAGQTSPFQVSIVDGGFSVKPGLVYSTSTGWQMPVIGGAQLTRDPPPVLAWGGSVAVICLEVQFDEFGQGVNLPWPIRAYSGPPQDIHVRRANGMSNQPQPGRYHVVIASVQNGTVHQWVNHNIIANLQWEQFFVWG